MSKQKHLVLVPVLSLMIICGCLSICSNPASLRSEALDEGTMILDGVTLAESTPIADILTDPDAFEYQLVQIEGLVVGMCQSQGCWAAVEDPAGNSLLLKVNDGVIDFGDYVELGNYMVGEGIFQPSGGHGAQVFIEHYGAMVGTTVCPVD